MATVPFGFLKVGVENDTSQNTERMDSRDGSNVSGEIGFLRVGRRLNVAMTITRGWGVVVRLLLRKRVDAVVVVCWLTLEFMQRMGKSAKKQNQKNQCKLV